MEAASPTKRERLERHLQPDRPRSLIDLAAEANREHELCETSTRAAIDHAVAAGTALMRARDLLPPGEWLEWLAEHFDGAVTTAYNYMRVATHEADLPGDATTMRDAIAATVGRRVAPGPAQPQLTEQREAAKRLHAAGISQVKISEQLGVSRNAVWAWCNPVRAKEVKKDQQKRQAVAREALRKAERDKQIRKAVRAAGQALSEAYAMAERMQDVLGQALDETEDYEARVALAEAIRWHHKTRDEIVRALGVS